MSELLLKDCQVGDDFMNVNTNNKHRVSFMCSEFDSESIACTELDAEAVLKLQQTLGQWLLENHK